MCIKVSAPHRWTATEWSKGSFDGVDKELCVHRSIDQLLEKRGPSSFASPNALLDFLAVLITTSRNKHHAQQDALLATRRKRHSHCLGDSLQLLRIRSITYHYTEQTWNVTYYDGEWSDFEPGAIREESSVH